MFQVDIVKIDNITILLIILLLLVPFMSSLKKIRWGEFEAEIEPSEVKKVEKTIKSLPEPEKEKGIVYETKKIEDGIHLALESDYILALAKLRIELEKLLNKILALGKKQYRNKLGVGQIVRILEKENIIDKSYIGPIKKVVDLCSRAIHGEEIREKDAHSIIELGLSLLDKLYSIYYDLAIKAIDMKEITNEERDEYANAKYEVTTVIPLVQAPYVNKYILTQEQLSQFLESYEEYGEFVIGIKKLDKNEK